MTQYHEIDASVAVKWFLQGKESRYFCESLFWASQPKQAALT